MPTSRRAADTMAAPARSEIPNRPNVLTAAKTFVTTGSPMSTKPAQLLSWHQARGHGAAFCHYRCDCGEDSMKWTTYVGVGG
ncbi:hypothetical protein AVEN_178024-1 [Araneus ventricosus]|uniref:Uncharacterized protein n=1 Tax=Araneus ventricosus TaxID=182803 RepID=A0A4Y2WS37_ARAVE|nr:hypothetical protein AVEN_178024-1 [Araneus ventricosus]